MTDDPERSVACIGLGLLGAAMGERLLDHGWRVSGFDVEQTRCREFERAGGRILESARQAASESVLLISLPTSEIVATVLDEIRDDMTTGTIIVDTTTGRPGDSTNAAAQLAARGIDYLDATVGGSSQLARDGDTIIMCGGDEVAFERCRPLFDVLSRETFYTGASGNGARMKLVVNLVLGLNRAVLAEGLAFAEATGIDQRLALQILKAGPAASRVMDTKGEKMLTGDFEPQARLAQHLKDVRLILESGIESGAKLPLSTLHRELLSGRVAAGDEALDNSAIIRAFQ